MDTKENATGKRKGWGTDGNHGVELSRHTVRVPRRFWKNNSPEFIEWQEYRLKTRKMPNGYQVTLGAIVTDTHIFLGASACAPDDVFDGSTASNLALGRARQQAFRFIRTGSIRSSLLMADQSDFAKWGPGSIYLPVSTFLSTRGMGIIEKAWITESPLRLSVVAAPYYAVVATNAEVSAAVLLCCKLDVHFGDRFDFDFTQRAPVSKPAL